MIYLIRQVEFRRCLLVTDVGKGNCFGEEDRYNFSMLID